MNRHHHYMKRCFQLAKLGEGFVAPNPMVGAVLVHEDRIIGEGYHQEYGKAHAEVNCLNAVADADKPLIAVSTLYVSLEPCAHYGKTPPCTDLIIQHNIPRVVIAVQDIFSEVNGKGIDKLRANATEVITGILEQEGRELIHQFLYFHKNNIPYITLKLAKTKDGFMGIRNREIQISNELALRYTHKLRATHQGILVGKNTVLSDNPSLNVRYANGKNPVRIVLGNEKDIPKDATVFNDEAVTLFLNGGLNEILHELANQTVISVLVEGGAAVLNQFIAANAWNEAHIITSGTTLETTAVEDRIKAPLISGVLHETITLEDNTVHVLKYPDALSYT
jgi:diaminohydroxyphosphoribosylaminopyrimidine deaminase / 5-amino-6-(5-phosphoribosylamino)uracil reductase